MEAEPCLGLCHKGAIFHLQSTVLVTFDFIQLQIDQQREGLVSAAIVAFGSCMQAFHDP